MPMKGLLLALPAATIGMAGSSLGATAAEPVATVASGTLEGTMAAEDVAVWRGVPYAAPPVGPLRWRAPQPVAGWTGVRPAKTFGASCPQVKEADTQLSPLEALSEDCLFLNIWAPLGKAAPQPVMVWIHGGGFIAGTGSEAQFDGSALARKGVVLVTLNYRLGRLGFFAHPALSAEHPEEPHGNYGLMDQIAALQWVRDNIGAFGGDPGNVTLFGESAGALSALALSTSPLAEGLFHKLILQSAPMKLPMRDIREDRPGLPAAETIGSEWARSMGIAGDGAEAIAALRDLPVDRIAPPAPDVSTIMSLMAGAGPMTDSRLLPDQPFSVYARGKHRPVPTIIGTNSREDVVWTFGDNGLGLTPIFPMPVEQILARLPEGKPRDEAWAAYLAKAGGDVATAEGMLRSDAFMGDDADTLAGMAARGAPTWLYRFDASPAQTRATVTGAPHGTEIFYVFGTLDRFRYKAGEASTQDWAISEQMTDYWASFAATGNPVAQGAPAWPAFDPSRPAALQVDNAGFTLRPDPGE